MIPVPDTKTVDVAFGNISWLPKWNDIPEEFKDRNCRTPENDLVSTWFFKGLTENDVERLRPRDGVDKEKALAACSACLCSWAPKHEHKEAGVAYLIREWFDLKRK